ncbi:hypothetical protein BOX15_Mlig006769g3, partial [Macrostomum lignano]
GNPQRLLCWAVAAALLAFLASYWLTGHQLASQSVEAVAKAAALTASSLSRVASSADNRRSDHSRRARVAVGLGANVDVRASSDRFLALLAAHGGAAMATKDASNKRIDRLKTASDIVADFQQRSSGRQPASERHLHNASLFAALVADLTAAGGVRGSQHHHRVSLGGCPVRLANSLAGFGFEVLLGAGRAAGRMRDRLAEGVSLAAAAAETKDSAVDVDEYRLLVEQADPVTGAHSWYALRRSQWNAQLSSLRSFQSRMEQFQPDLLVLAGLQAIHDHPQSAGLLRDRLSSLVEFLTASGRVKTHLRLPPLPSDEPKFAQLMLEFAMPYADSLFLDGRGLVALLGAMETGNPPAVPVEPATVTVGLDLLRRLYSVLRTTSVMNGRRKVSRLHLRSRLGYQALLVTHRAGWPDPESAVAAASLAAYRAACGRHDDTEASYNSVSNLQSRRRIHPRLLGDSLPSNAAVSPNFGFGFAKSSEPDFFDNWLALNATRPVGCWTESPDFTVCLSLAPTCVGGHGGGGGGGTAAIAAGDASFAAEAAALAAQLGPAEPIVFQPPGG